MSRRGIVWLALPLVAFSSLACGEPVPISVSSLRDDPDDSALVDDALAILGLEWEPSRRSRGTIHLTLVDRAEESADRGGVTELEAPRCYKAIVALRDEVFVAHEIGHALGLEHVCEAPCPAQFEDNLMRGDPDVGVELTEDQSAQLDKGRRRLTGCR